MITGARSCHVRMKGGQVCMRRLFFEMIIVFVVIVVDVFFQVIVVICV